MNTNFGAIMKAYNDRPSVYHDMSLSEWMMAVAAEREQVGRQEEAPQPAQPVSAAAAALDDMRGMIMLDGAPVQEVSAAALVAIAEQLAVLNKHMESIAESQRDIALSAIY